MKKRAIVCSFLARGLLLMVKLKLTYRAAVVKKKKKIKEVKSLWRENCLHY